MKPKTNPFFVARVDLDHERMVALARRLASTPSPASREDLILCLSGAGMCTQGLEREPGEGTADALARFRAFPADEVPVALDPAPLGTRTYIGVSYFDDMQALDRAWDQALADLRNWQAQS